MNSGSVTVLGIMVGIMIAAFFLTRKGRKKECEYDEMQLKIRAKGYQIGFFTALLLILLLIFVFEMNLLTFATPGFAAYAILIISVVVFAIYCILHDAFLSISGNAKSYLGIFSLVVLVEGFVTVRYAIQGELFENGQLTFGGGAPALMFVCFLAILITLIVKTVRNRKGAEE